MLWIQQVTFWCEKANTVRSFELKETTNLSCTRFTPQATRVQRCLEEFSASATFLHVCILVFWVHQCCSLFSYLGKTNREVNKDVSSFFILSSVTDKALWKIHLCFALSRLALLCAFQRTGQFQANQKTNNI